MKLLLFALLTAAVCFGTLIIIDLPMLQIALALVVVACSLTFVGCLFVSISRKISATISPYRVFAAVIGIVGILVLIYAIYDIQTDIGWIAGLAGVLLLVFVMPIIISLLIIDFILWRRHIGKNRRETNMKRKHMNLYFPQWQGSGTVKALLDGARQIKNEYLGDCHLSEVDVSDADICDIENDILGYRQIVKQLKSANEIVAAEKPESIFTVGGGCDVETIPISYLQKVYDGDMTVLWIDAHGDLNTPESSPSKLFHGMPLRALLGDGDPKIDEVLFSHLQASQIVLIGQRSLDEPEVRYIEKCGISRVSGEDVIGDIGTVINTIKAKGSDNIYVHIDLDVLDVEEFPYVMVPEAGGLRPQQLVELIMQLKEKFNIVGVGLLEYASSDEKDINVLSDIIEFGRNL